jgi:hypothetical protein
MDVEGIVPGPLKAGFHSLLGNLRYNTTNLIMADYIRNDNLIWNF